MNPLVAKLAPYGVAAALAAGLVASYTAQQRRIGREEILLRGADSTLAVAKAQAADLQRRLTLDSGRAVALEADTAKANRAARAAESRYSALAPAYSHAKATLDSVLAQAPESVSTAVAGAVAAYQAQADSSLHACAASRTAEQSALAACQAHGQALQAEVTDLRGLHVSDSLTIHARTLQLKVARQDVPSGFSTWLWRIGAFGAGLLIGRIK